MAPKHSKLAQGSGGDNVAAKLRGQGSVGDHPSENVWAELPPKVCTSCRQSTHDLDRDCAPGNQFYLVWAKKQKRADGRFQPAGVECYKCFDTRRRHFQGYTAPALCEARKDSRALDDRYHELRADRVRGENQYKSAEQVDVQSYVKKSRAQFNELFQEGTFHELWAFAALRRLPFDHKRDGDEERLKQHITEQLRMDVVQDAQGVWGVEVLDHGTGQYRFRRGLADKVERTKREQYDNKDMERERVAMLNQKQQDAGGGWRPLSLHGHQDGFGSTTHVGRGASSARSSAPSEYSHGCNSPTSLGALSDRSPSPPPVAVRGRERVAGPTSSADSSRPTRVPTDGKRRVAVSQSPSMKNDEDESMRRFLESKKRRTSSDIAIDAAQTLMLKVVKTMTFEQHWNQKGRRREFDALIGRLAACGRRCGNFLADETAAETSQRCFNLSDNLEARQEMFESIRDDFAHFALQPMNDKTVQVLRDSPPATLGSILTTSMQQLVDSCLGKREHVQAIVSTLTFCPRRSSPTVRLSMLGDSATELAEQSQRGIILSLAEKILKSTDTGHAITALLEFDHCMPKANSVDLDNVDIREPHDLSEHGWFAQPWCDAACVRVCGHFLKAARDGTQVSRSVRAQCVSVVQNKHKLSSRLKSLFKMMNGAQTQHGKTAWDAMVRIHDEHIQRGKLDDAFLEKMLSAAEGVQKAAAAEDVTETYNALVDLVNDHKEDCQQLTLAFGDDGEDATDGGDKDDDGEQAVDGLAVARKMGNALVMAGKVTVGHLAQHITVIPQMVKTSWMAEGFPGFQQQLTAADDVDDPDEIRFLSVVEEVLALVEGYCKPSDRVMLTFTKERVAAMSSIYQTWENFARGGGAVDAIGQWSALWEGFMTSQGTPPLTTASSKMGLGELLRVLPGSPDAKGMITHFAINVLGPVSEDSAAALRECQNKADILPRDIQNVVSAVTVLNRLKGHADKINSGKDVGGVLELTTIMAAASTVRDQQAELVAHRPDFDVDYKLVLGEWEKVLLMHLDKCGCKDLVDAFLKKHSPILTAARSWNFADVEWIHKPSTPAEDKIAKSVEQVITQYKTWAAVLERIAQNIHWAEQTLQVKVKTATAETPQVTSQIEKLGQVLACMVLCSQLVGAATGTSDLAACVKYVTKVLMVKLDDLPPTLVTKVQGSGGGGKEGEAPPPHSEEKVAPAGAAKLGKPLKKVSNKIS